MEDYTTWESNDGHSRDFDNMEAVEATNFTGVQSVRDGVSMKLNIQTQEIMDMNIKTLKLKEVTNQAAYEGGYIPTIGGLFSEVIFGTTQEERKKTWGYIDLHTKVIHPYIYTVLVALQHNIDDVCSGKGSWKIDDKNQLVKVDKDDPEYDPDNTGIDWFIKHYPEIKFKRNNSMERNEKISLLETFAPDEIFIHTWLVMPPFLRDAEFRDGPPRLPEINTLYSNLIRYSMTLKSSEGIGFMSNIAKYNIQKYLVAILKHFQNLIEKSDGFFHQYVLGKNPDYGARSVISCAVLDQYDKPGDDPIDMNNTGIPLAQVCSMIFPFVRRWVYNFFENEFSKNNKIETTSGEIVELDHPMDLYTKDYIKKKMDHWLNTYEDRFESIVVPLKNGRLIPIQFRGTPYANDPQNVNASTISKRNLTWTDVFYMAAVECVENKVVWITRYPIVHIQNTVPSQVHVLSTIKTLPVIIDGRVYPYYPVIDPKLSKDMVARSFNDTVNMTNMFLKGMNGDYDGDTVSMRIPFLEESNEESKEIMMSLKNYLDAQGGMIRNLSNESFFMLYSMTRSDANAPKADDITKGKFLSMDYNDIGIKMLTELFGTSYNRKTKTYIAPKYNVCTKVHLKAGEFTNKDDVDTTLGRLVFNKIMIAPYVAKVIPGGYVNDEMVSKKIKGMFDVIARGAMYDKITTAELWPFLKAFEFYTTKGVTIFAPSYSAKMIMPDKELLSERDKFFKENPNPTIDEMVNMENKLVAKATKSLEQDPSYPLFASDARGSVADNYKTMDIFVGPVQNPVNGEWDRIESDFISGFKKEELAAAGNMLINGQYPKSCGTAEAGYITKQFNAVFQSVTVDNDGTDCGTKSYILVKLTESNWKLYEFQNVYDGNKLVVLDENTVSKFMNKVVKMRSPMCCTANTICSACAGRRPYIMGITNIGLQFSDMPNMLLEANMKKFHTAKVAIAEIDPNTLLI